jgi:ribosomal protein S25
MRRNSTYFKENQMFKNHSIKIKLVKDATDETTTEEAKTPTILTEENIAIAKDFVKHVGIVTVLAVGATVAFKTLGQMAVVTTQAAVNKKNEN